MKKIIAKETIPNIPETNEHIIVKNFSLDSAESFHVSFNKMNQDNTVSVIPIIIASYGGSVYGLIAMLDVLKTATKPVATVAMGAAMSCGAILLSAGTKGYRYAGEYADIMVHEVATVSMGKITEVKADAKHTNKLNKLLLGELARNSGKKDQDFYIKEMKKRTNLDWFLSAREAKALGIVDHVGVPLFVKK